MATPRLEINRNYHPDPRDARNRRILLLCQWKGTESAEEREKIAPELLAAMNSEDVACRGHPAYKTWRERRADREPVACLPFFPYPPYPTSETSGNTTVEGQA
ncbi:hypothetical protein F5884DRAFT_852612 [Xylogone sp. PMI_703]|nr:hypothetical protein F5884DRAFT_852612 [Xylogone sp. PMI_703]